MKVLLALCIEPGDPAEVQVPLLLPCGRVVILTDTHGAQHTTPDDWQPGSPPTHPEHPEHPDPPEHPTTARRVIVPRQRT